MFLLLYNATPVARILGAQLLSGAVLLLTAPQTKSSELRDRRTPARLRQSGVVCADVCAPCHGRPAAPAGLLSAGRRRPTHDAAHDAARDVRSTAADDQHGASEAWCVV